MRKRSCGVVVPSPPAEFNCPMFGRSEGIQLPGKIEESSSVPWSVVVVVEEYFALEAGGITSFAASWSLLLLPGRKEKRLDFLGEG